MEAYQKTKQALNTDQVKVQGELEIKNREMAAKAAAQERDLQAKLQLEEIKQQGESARALAKIDHQRASEILQTEVRRLEQLIERNVAVSNREEERFERLATEQKQKAAAPAPGQQPPRRGPSI